MRDYECDSDVICIQPGEASDAKMMKLGSQDAAVKEPLIAVKRIVENGNVVQFGMRDADNFILSVETGDKIMLVPNGTGSYLMQARFTNGDRT